MAKIAVLGAGGWGTALAIMANQYGHAVSLWSPFAEEVEAIRRFDEHKKLLPGVPVPPEIRLTTDLACVRDARLVIMAVPSFAIAGTAGELRPLLSPGTLVANAGKGLEPGTHRRFTQVIAEALPDARVTALSGPSHAEEVARGVPTSVIDASEDVAAAEEDDGALVPADDHRRGIPAAHQLHPDDIPAQGIAGENGKPRRQQKGRQGRPQAPRQKFPCGACKQGASGPGGG